MSYIINKTNGDVLVELFDGTTNTETGLTLIGRNYVSYGEIQNENFLRLLENFADNIPPGQSVGFAPIAGTLWWDTGNQRLNVYNGVNFIPVSEQTVANVAPTIKKTGDQWWDTVNSQLKVWTGTGWQLIGPVYSTGQGTSGPVVETILDSNSDSRVVLVTYSGGNVVSITSGYTSAFTPLSPVTGFTTINPGINLINGTMINGTATNSVSVGGLFANVFARVDANTTFTKDVAITGTASFTDANIYFGNKSLNIQNKNFNGNIELYVNGASGNVRAVQVDGSTGLSYVTGSPTKEMGIANKGYVDLVNSTLTNIVETQISQINGNVTQVNQDLSASISALTLSTNANLNLAVSSINTDISTLTGQVNSQFAAATANAVAQSQSITNLNNAVVLLAPINNPTLTGIASAPDPVTGANSTQIATTSFVSNAAAVITTDYSSRISQLSDTTAVNLANGLALKANLASPVLTGVPMAPTPTAGNSSTMIATTAFVNTSIAAKQFNYTVATTGPGDTSGVISSTNGAAGNNGDFWFQIG